MDIKEIKQIVSLMNENDLVEFELEEDAEGRKLRMRKAAAFVSPAPAPMPMMIAPQAAAPMMPAGAAAPEAASAPDEPPTEVTRKVSNTVQVTSPMPGTFYRAPSPNHDVFVELGDTVKPDTVLCIIEAMKVMNEIHAEHAGDVVDVLVENGEAVEYGQPLFVIKPASAGG